MSSNQRVFFAVLIFIILILPVSMLPGASSTAPPVAKAGAPGDGSCAECHTGSVTVPGKVVIDFGKLAYVPNEKQTIRVRVYREQNPMLVGFQLTARLSTNGQAGFFEAGENTVIQVKDGAQYISHKGPHVSYMDIMQENMTNGDFVFTWTPPGPNAGDVTFYASAVAGAANGVPDGNVYTAVTKYRAAQTDLPAGYRWQTITVPGETFLGLRAISSSGLILASGQDSKYLMYPAGQIVTLRNVPGGNAVNAAGRVAGSSQGQGFVWEPSGQIARFTIPGLHQVAGISDGDVVFGGHSRTNFADSLFVRSGTTVESYSFSSSYNRPDGITSSGVAYSGHYMTPMVHLRSVDGTFRDVSFCMDSLRALYQIHVSDTGIIAGTCAYDVDLLHSSFIAAENGRMLVTRKIYPLGVNNAGQILARGGGDELLLTPCSARPLTTTLTAPRAGGTVTIPVQSEYADCRPNAVGPKVEPFHPPGSVSFQLPENTTGSERVTRIWVAGGEVTVTQPGPVCTPAELSGTELIQASGGAHPMRVLNTTGCSWSLTSTVDWLKPQPSSGTGFEFVSILASPNAGPPRVGTVVLNGTSYRIVQMGGVPCVYQLTPSSVRIPAQGGPVSIQISSILGCPWNGFPPQSGWLNLQGEPSSPGGSGVITFVAAVNPYEQERSTTIYIGNANVVVPVTQEAAAPAPASAGLRLVTMAKCRIADTRPEGNLTGAFGAPQLAAGGSRELPVLQSGCSIPPSARAYVLHLTLFPIGPVGYASVYPKGTARPLVSTLNSLNGRAVSNMAIVPAGNSGAIELYASGETHATVDITGYFVAPTSELYYQSGLVYSPHPPCRSADSRIGNQPILPGANRILVQFACPASTLQGAVAMNVTAIPIGPLDGMNVSSTGQPSNPAFTVRATDGQVTANFGIIPTPSASPLSVSVTQTAHVAADQSGYFYSTFGGMQPGLRYFPVAPCRVADTRASEGRTGAFGPPQLPAGGVREIPVPQSACGIPSTANAYVLNFTVVPAGPLSYITAWPAGSSQPLVSTLNSYLGQIVANAAIVPAGNDGAIRVFASNATDLVVDISGYFAP